MAEYVKELKSKGFSIEQLEQAKRRLRYAYESRNITASMLLNKLYEYRIYDKILDDERNYKLAMSLTLEECNALIDEIFDTNFIACTVYGEIKKKDLISEKKFFNLFKQ